MKLLHKIIFWSHLLAGVIGGVVIFIMSITGVILMYEHQLVEYAERNVREVVPPGAAAPRMSLDELVTKAREQNPGSQPTGIVLRGEPTASIAVGFGRAGATYVNPYTGAVLGKGSKIARLVSRRHRLAPLARHRRRQPSHRQGDHRCLQFGFFLACRHRSLSLVAAQLALAWIENESAVQYPLARQSARLELAQRHRLLVFNGARRAHVDRRSHVLPLGQRSTLHDDRQRAAAAPHGRSRRRRRSGNAGARSTRRTSRCRADGELRCSIGAGARAGARLGDDYAALAAARRRAGNGFDTRTRCLSSVPALAAHAPARHRRCRQVGALCQQQYGAKTAHLGARAAHRRSIRISRPNRRRDRFSRRLFSRLDRVSDGLAPLPLLAPRTGIFYC